MSEQSFYLNDIPLEEAKARIARALAAAGRGGILPAEEIPLERALGRVSAEAVWAAQSSPHYHGAAMDGYALRAKETQGATDRDPIELSIGERAIYVDTGDPLPAWSDAVVPIEHVEPVGSTDGRGRAREGIRLRAGLTPWKNVRSMGEDLVATELVIPAGQVLRPVDLGAIAGAGHASVPVTRRPSVAVLPTGSELVGVGVQPNPGQIIEYNSLVLAAQIEGWGGAVRRLPPVADDAEEIANSLREACSEHDLVLVIAGSSAGAEDYTASVVAELGELLFHGVAVRPGHPVIFGMIQEKERPTPVLGIPGYPVSAALTGEIFVEPILARWLGRRPIEPPTMEVEMAQKVRSSMGDDEYLRVVVGEVGSRRIASPLQRGAGVISSLVRADGVVVIPAGTQGIEAGEEVAVQLYRPPAEVERALVAQGSHDLTLDLICQELARRGRRLTSTNVGSLGGLLALRRGHAHLAGCHLIDPESGEYNLAYVRRYLPERAILLLRLVERVQGLVVAEGNPLGLRELADLAAGGVRYVNRQQGAGTRVLLDYELERGGISSKQIDGYEREEFTHLTVAAAVASGSADAGLAIQAAAEALDLGFVPLFEERYDLAVPREIYDSEKFLPLLELLADPEFQSTVAALPGYGVKAMGEVIAQVRG